MRSQQQLRLSRSTQALMRSQQQLRLSRSTQAFLEYECSILRLKEPATSPFLSQITPIKLTILILGYFGLFYMREMRNYYIIMVGKPKLPGLDWKII
jgi:hypothetical protein